jgi:hypothetical protein
MRYRRNSDEDIRDLERRFQAHSGQQELQALVAAYIRANSFSLFFLLEHPEAFEFLPEDIRDRIIEIACNSEEAVPDDSVELFETEDYLEEEEDDEDDTDEEDPALEAARASGEVWECASCGDDDFYEGNQGEEWQLLSEEAAQITNAKIGRGEEGAAMCEECLSQAGLDLEQAASDDLSDEFCLECGETHDECTC